jgi:hypothetical protein
MLRGDSSSRPIGEGSNRLSRTDVLDFLQDITLRKPDVSSALSLRRHNKHVEEGIIAALKRHGTPLPLAHLYEEIHSVDPDITFLQFRRVISARDYLFENTAGRISLKPGSLQADGSPIKPNRVAARPRLPRGATSEQKLARLRMDEIVREAARILSEMGNPMTDAEIWTALGSPEDAPPHL